jgi:hypothetical protein
MLTTTGLPANRARLTVSPEKTSFPSSATGSPGVLGALTVAGPVLRARSVPPITTAATSTAAKASPTCRARRLTSDSASGSLVDALDDHRDDGGLTRDREGIAAAEVPEAVDRPGQRPKGLAAVGATNEVAEHALRLTTS